MYELTIKKRNLKKIEKRIDLQNPHVKGYLRKLCKNPYIVTKALEGIFKQFKIRSYRVEKNRLFLVIHENKKQIEMLYAMPRKRDYKFKLKEIRKWFFLFIHKF